jgi:hypothetical protein
MRQFIQFSLSTSELEGAIEHSSEYINNVFNKQGTVMSFDLIYGDDSIHKLLGYDRTKELYDKLAKEYEASK